MASADALMNPERDRIVTNPWPWLLGALGAVAVGFAWVQVFPDALTPVRVVLVFGGMVAAGIAVAVRPASALVLAGAGLAAFGGSWALFVGDGNSFGFFRAVFGRLEVVPIAPGPWDSIRLVLAVAAVVAWAAALIVLLPRLWRRIVVSLLIVFHFGGILSAALSPQPAPWLANVIYAYVYRNYLEFMYLTNAYHFYSPNPGPAYFFWFYIDYQEDGKARLERIQVPDLDDDGWPQYPLAIQYQRRLALASLSAEGLQVNAKEFEQAQVAWGLENIRRYASKEPMIPHYPEPVLQPTQYLPPKPLCKQYVESYVRHVAHDFKDEHPNARIQTIKVYRVEHRWLSAGQFKAGWDPQGPMTYFTYFWGAYDTGGHLSPKKDAFLYWLIPMINVPPNMVSALVRPSDQNPAIPPDQITKLVLDASNDLSRRGSVVLNYVRLHAGEKKWVLYEPGKPYEEP